MEISRTIRVNICDLCGTEKEAWRKCHHCKKDICHDCIGNSQGIVRYSKQVGIDSTCFAFCLPCDKELKKNPTPLFTALLEVKALTVEYEKFIGSFRDAKTDAEAALFAILEEGQE